MMSCRSEHSSIDALTARADKIKRLYAEQNRRKGHQQWGVTEYTQGLVGDVGDLMKLIMARDNYRSADDIDQRITHELVDCLWSVLVIASELDVGLEAEFAHGMQMLEERITVRTESE